MPFFDDLQAALRARERNPGRPRNSPVEAIADIMVVIVVGIMIGLLSVAFGSDSFLRSASLGMIGCLFGVGLARVKQRRNGSPPR